MLNLNPQYITDSKGKRISVVLPIKQYVALLEELEELEDIKEYDRVKGLNESTVPLAEVVKKIRSNIKQ